jgi:alkylation response protein AidB-like acyl-CoA dehydrogenase
MIRPTWTSAQSPRTAIGSVGLREELAGGYHRERTSLAAQRSAAVASVRTALNAFTWPGSAVSAAQENLERAIEVAAKALQVHGGYGYTQDFAVERLLRDAISLRAATGVTHAATGA